MRPAKQMRLSLQEALGMGNAFGDVADAPQSTPLALIEEASGTPLDPLASSHLAARIAVQCGECLHLLHRLHQFKVCAVSLSCEAITHVCAAYAGGSG
jgi:hypothetical protein